LFQQALLKTQTDLETSTLGVRLRLHEHLGIRVKGAIRLEDGDDVQPLPRQAPEDFAIANLDEALQNLQGQAWEHLVHAHFQVAVSHASLFPDVGGGLIASR
jgi:hypothetical protein